MDFPIYFLLASAVWLIYTVDHLRDSKHAKKPKRARYLFHERHESTLRIAVGIVILLSVLSVFLVPITILLGGVILGVLSLLYLIIQQKLASLGLKELYVAFIYTLGILLAPFVLSMKFDFFAFTLLFVATFLNLIIFSWFEESEDRKDGFNSIATVWNSKKLEKLILFLLSSGMALTLLNFSLTAFYFLIVFVVFSAMVLRRKSVLSLNIYRSIGDGVFLLPILFELL